MSPYEAHAYSLALALQRVLSDLCELPANGAGSRIEQAYDAMDEVIEMLEPQESDEGATAIKPATMTLREHLVNMRHALAEKRVTKGKYQATVDALPDDP